MDPLGLGLDVDDRCGLIASDGGVDPRLYAVGPLTRGSFWEIVAVPDIRSQVAVVGESLAFQLVGYRPRPTHATGVAADEAAGTFVGPARSVSDGGFSF